MNYMTPEQQARVNIDRLLDQTGWAVQNADSLNLYASSGVAAREFALKPGHGHADYLLYVNQKAVGVVEAKREGHTLAGVEVQSEKYSTGLPDNLPAYWRPLPFLYESTGTATQFTNLLDPEPRSRPTFSFHTPTTLAAWLGAQDGASKPSDLSGHSIAETGADYQTPHNLRQRLKTMPPLDVSGLRSVQERAIRNLEESLAAGRPRALVQMATGSGKTRMACNQGLPLDQVRQSTPCPISGGSEQPGAPNPAGVPRLHHAGRRAEVHRALQRAAPAIWAHRPGEPSLHLHHSASLLDAEGRGARPRVGGALRL